MNLPSDSTLASAATGASTVRAPWLRWFGALSSGGGFENRRYLMKWLCISTAIGVVAGLGAVAFTFAIEWVTQASLGRIVGYLPPSPLGEGNAASADRPSMAAAVGNRAGRAALRDHRVLARARSRRARYGCGNRCHPPPRWTNPGPHPADQVDRVCNYDWHRRLRWPRRTDGTDSAGFGSLLAQWLGLSVQERRIAVAVGMGAGIGSIFRAPLGGALMAAEILYIHDLEVEALSRRSLHR